MRRRVNVTQGDAMTCVSRSLSSWCLGVCGRGEVVRRSTSAGDIVDGVAT
jgi:hypothetical protein